MRQLALVPGNALPPSLGRLLAGCILLLMVLVYVASRERAPRARSRSASRR